MQMIEILHQLGPYSKITVGSEENVPGPGWPYDTILGDLTSTPTITPKDFGSSIVQRYIDSYAPATDETKSAVINSDIPAIVTAVDSLAQALINAEPNYYTQIQQSRTDACHFDDADYRPV